MFLHTHDRIQEDYRRNFLLPPTLLICTWGLGADPVGLWDARWAQCSSSEDSRFVLSQGVFDPSPYIGQSTRPPRRLLLQPRPSPPYTRGVANAAHLKVPEPNIRWLLSCLLSARYAIVSSDVRLDTGSLLMQHSVLGEMEICKECTLASLCEKSFLFGSFEIQNFGLRVYWNP
jgi:hypothetical protein